jgi:CDP-paratose 2-epimerase
VPAVTAVRSRVILVTGSRGLIGSAVVRYFAARSFAVVGIDGNQRVAFFGPEGDNTLTFELLRRQVPSFKHYSVDIRSRDAVMELVGKLR